MLEDTVDEGDGRLDVGLISNKVMYWRNDNILSNMKWLKVSLVI